MTSLRDYARQCTHTEAQAECEHRDTGTRQDIASDDPDRWIWWCRDCDQTFQYHKRAVQAAAWQELIEELKKRPQERKEQP